MTYNTKFETRHLPPDVQDLVDTIINGIVALASRVNSNSDSNSLGGILIHPLEGEMPEMKPRPKAPKGEQLSEALQDELATYEKVGLFPPRRVALRLPRLAYQSHILTAIS